MQPQQIQPDRLECGDGVLEPLLHEVALGTEIGDDAILPRRDCRIGRPGMAHVRQRLLQLLEPGPHALRVLLEPVHDLRQIAELPARLFGKRFVELFGRHAERELGGTMGQRRRECLRPGEHARDAEQPPADAPRPQPPPEFGVDVAPALQHDERSDTRCDSPRH